MLKLILNDSKSYVLSDFAEKGLEKSSGKTFGFGKFLKQERHQCLDNVHIIGLSLGLFYKYENVIRFDLNGIGGTWDLLSDKYKEDSRNKESSIIDLDALAESVDNQDDNELKLRLAIAFNRAYSLLSMVFDHDDPCWLIFQDYSADIDGNAPLFKEWGIHNSLNYFDIPYPYEHDYSYFGDQGAEWKQAVWRGNWKDLQIANIIQAIVHMDFPDLGWNKINSEVYIINPKLDLIVNIYDDRGVDILANSFDHHLFEKINLIK